MIDTVIIVCALLDPNPHTLAIVDDKLFIDGNKHEIISQSKHNGNITIVSDDCRVNVAFDKSVVKSKCNGTIDLMFIVDRPHQCQQLYDDLNNE